MSEVIYKICTRAEWDSAVAVGIYRGSADDLRDGFIHFSRESQVAGTLQKHFSGRTDLLLVSVEVARLGAALKLEPSRGGELFPHLYGELPTALASSVSPIAETPTG